MKLIFVLILTVSSAFAGELICLQTEGQETQGMVVKAEIVGKFEVSSNEIVTFSTVSYKYSIGEQDDYIWSRGKQTALNLSNYEEYRPRVYKDHMKFSQYIQGEYRTEYDGFGALDLIIPKNVLLANKSSIFTSFLIMSYMDDHFGGTISLNCEIN